MARSEAHPLVELAWTTVGQLGAVGRVDRAARRMGLARVEGRALRRAVWTGASGARPVRVRASTEGGLGLRLEVGAPLELPGCLVERGRDGLGRSGHVGLAAWVEDRLAGALRPGDAVGLSAEGARFSSSRRAAAASLERWLARLDALLDALTEAELPRLFLGRVESAPSPEVRAGAARALFRDHPGTPEARAAEAAVRADPDGRVRLAASERASRLEDAIDVCASVAEEEGLPLSVRREAILELAERARERPEAALDALRAAGEHPEPALRAVVALAAGRLGAVTTDLLDALAADPEPQVREAAARGLGELGGRDAEAILLRLVDPEVSPERRLPPGADLRELSVRRAATEILGRTGGLASLDVLTRLTEQSGLRAPLADATLGAIRAIRLRQPAGAPGQLSLLGSTGALSDPAPDGRD